MNHLHRTHLNTDWTFVETAREKHAEWLPAQVPGHVHMDLVRAGVIGRPFERMNELGSRWVDETGWSYRRTFEWAPKEGLPKRVLRFEGLDTICTVWLNGERIAEHDNMFTPLEIDVSNALREGPNELRVDFQPAAKIAAERKAAYFAAEGLSAETGAFMDRAFTRKAQYMYGWDWGPSLISCGIWKPVALLEYASRILDVRVRTRRRKDGAYVVSLHSEIEGPGHIVHALVDDSGELVGQIERDGDIVVPEPNLWWSHDLGEPYLYRLGSYIEVNGNMADSLVGTPVGLREIKLVQKEDAFGTSFGFELNGVKVWARGANWIPNHSFPSQVTGRDIREQLERATDMRMNTLRVWGGGLYESEAFYNAADELGILIWQDCTYACSMVPDTGEWLDVAREETAVNVKRLRNHPSLAHWCGNNENLMCWDYGWGGADRQAPRFYGKNIYETVIPEVLAELDPTRPYTSSSPWGGEKSNDDTIGDQHNWSVWHGGDWPKYTDSKARFCSEFGFASSPSVAAWRKWIAPEDWDHASPVARWHDKTGKGYDTFQGYVTNHYPPSATLEDWVYYSQLNQRDALRHGIEHYRRSEFCRGTLIWQINDCWPVQSWALIDCEGRWKAAAHELIRIFDDELVTISRNGSKVAVDVVNDCHGFDLEDEPVALLAVNTLTGEVVSSWEAVASLKSGQRKQVLEVDVAGLPTAETILFANWAGRCGCWRLLGEPKDARLSLPVVTVRIADDGMAEIHSDLPIVDLVLSGPNDEEPIADNFITLPLGGSTSAAVVAGAKLTTLKARSLAGVHEVRIVNGPFA